MKRIVVALAALMSLGLSPLRAMPSPVEMPAEPPTTGLTPDEIRFENDAHVLALALYWEGGSTGESREGLRRIAEVIKTRVRLNRPDFGGRDLYGVVFHANKTKTGAVCQFSFACLPQTRRAPIPGARWENARAVAREALLDPAPPQPDEIAEYYLNPAFSSLRSLCWFKTKLVAAGRTGSHIFWREPKPWDAPRATADKPEECVRYEAIVAAQKARAAQYAKAHRKRLALAKRHKLKRGARYASLRAR